MEESLYSSGIDFDVFMTAGKGHAIEISSDLRGSDYDLVVAVGGDGTVHEVANGIRGSDMRLGVIPMGNGDDFARSIGIPLNDIDGAVSILKQGVDYNVGGIRVEGLKLQNIPEYPHQSTIQLRGSHPERRILFAGAFLSVMEE